MRVLISVGWLGGAGGAERNAYSIIRALAADRVDVVTRQRLGGQLGETSDDVRVFSSLDWRWRYAAMRRGIKGAVAQVVLNPIRRRLSRRYDVYLQLLNGANVSRAVGADMRLLIPSGQQVPAALAADFDFVATQAPDNGRFLPPNTRSLVLSPPVYALSESSHAPAVKLPEKFYLTVFNPYDPFKGAEDLKRIIAEVPHPIVWCHSQATKVFHDMPALLSDHPSVVHVDDPTNEQFRYLYERCLAYLAFSRWEGFGWAIADALRYSPAVVSRPVGVLSYPEAQKMAGVHLLGDDWSVDWSILPNEAHVARPRDLPFVSPERFRATLLEWHSRRGTT